MSASADGTWRPVGFFVLMIGLGLRLDTSWQGLASVLIVLGGAGCGVGLWLFSRRLAASASVPGGGKG